MAVLKLVNSEVLVDNFPVGKNSKIDIGYTFEFKKQPEFRQENTSDWYKKLAGRSFQVVNIVIKYEWNNGGMSRGLGSNVEYVLGEINK